MGRLDCVHRGPRVRILPCGCPSGVVVLECRHPDRPDECVLIQDGGKRGAAIAEAGIQVCRGCDGQVVPPPRPPLPLFGSQCLVLHGEAEPSDVPLANRLWEKARAATRKMHRPPAAP
jgi:hypothetical protein